MTEIKSPEDDSIPFYPTHLRTEFYVTIGVFVLIILVGLIGLFSPIGLGDSADPMNTPAHVKPEWYFLALYQLLKYIPKTSGAVIPVIALILLTIWPFIDKKPDKSKRAQLYRLIAVVCIMLFLVVMTIWGEVS